MSSAVCIESLAAAWLLITFHGPAQWIATQTLIFRGHASSRSSLKGETAAAGAIGAGAAAGAASANHKGEGSAWQSSQQSERQGTRKEDGIKKGENGEGQNIGSKDDAAARLIQRNYRRYASERAADGNTISADARWGEAMGRVKLDGAAKAADCGGKNDAGSRWKRGGVLVGQLAGSPSAQLGGTKDTAPVEGGPSLNPQDELRHAIEASQDPAEDGKPEKTSSQGMVGDVPGANDDGKVDNIRSIAKPRQKGLRLIERWTRGAPAQELSKVMEAQYWVSFARLGFSSS